MTKRYLLFVGITTKYTKKFLKEQFVTVVIKFMGGCYNAYNSWDYSEVNSG